MDESDPTTPASALERSGRSGWLVLGIVLIFFGAGLLTIAMFSSEFHFEGGRAGKFGYIKTLLAALASFGQLVAGVVLIVSAFRAAAAKASARLVKIGVFLIFASAAAWIFGFVVCLSNT